MTIKHVDKSVGSDTGTTGPFASIGYGTRQILGSDALEVHDGTYEENITHIPAGSERAHTRVYAGPGESVIVRPTVQSPGGAVVWLDGAYHHVSLEGLQIDGSHSTQIGAWFSTNNGYDVHSCRLVGCRVIAGEGTGSGGAIDLGSHNPIAATGRHQIINCIISGGGKPSQCGYSCASYGVYVKVPNCILQGNEIFDTSGAGIHVYSGGAAPHNTIINRNRIHDIVKCGSVNQVWGILIASGNGCRITQNLVYRIKVPGSEVNLGNGAIVVGMNGTIVIGNTCDDNFVPGVVVGSAALDTLVRNNIAFRSGSHNYINSGQGTIADHNLMDGTNPLFVAPDMGDYHLTDLSPAIGKGVMDVMIPRDFYGMFRSEPTSIGAAEFGGTLPPEPPPVPVGEFVITGNITSTVNLKLVPVTK